MCAWNARGLNKVHKQFEVVRFLFTYNISLIGLLETKVKRKELGAFYLCVFPNWCVTTNLAWHEGGRIIVGWMNDDVQVNILVCTSQLIHIGCVPQTGSPFCCTFVYGSSARR